MHPVFSRLSDEVLLTSPGAGVAFGGVTARSDKIVQARKLDYQSIVVVLPERFCAETCRKTGFQMPRGHFLDENQYCVVCQGSTF